MAEMNGSDTKRHVRYRWLQAMYVANIVISGGIGIGTLIAPETMRTLLELPPQDPVHFGIATGAVPLAFGAAGVWGLWAPIRVSPILLLQAGYKVLFLAGVALPMALSGALPSYALPVVGIFVFFVVGNGIAVPYSHIFGGESTADR